MNREINIIKYLPLFVQNYKEIEQIMISENPEIQFIENETQILKNNQFITTCDLLGIERFEKLLKIIPDESDNLQDRIKKALTRWNNTIPYTYRVLIDKLNFMCGEDSYLIYPNFNEYELNIIIKNKALLREIDFMVSQIVPANIIATLQNNSTNAHNLYTANILNTKTKQKLNRASLIKTLENKVYTSSVFIMKKRQTIKFKGE